MLYKEILEGKTLELLKVLMRDDYLRDFNLVGGTALSLYLGHRKSIDLDLFTKEEFDVQELRKHLVETYGFEERFLHKQTLKGTIDGVFIDCIRYDYPSLLPANYFDNIRITSIPDLLAMKIAAITDNGEREKDFVDIAFFSKRYSLSEILDFYQAKYTGVSNVTATKALLYFNDIKRDEPLKLCSGEYSWESIEKRLKKMVEFPDQVFTTFPNEKTKNKIFSKC